MKTVFKGFIIIFILVILLGMIEVNTAKITIVKDENPDRVNVLSFNYDTYYIEIGELGLILGFRCNENSLGEITIVLTDSNEGYIYQLMGEVSNHFDVNNYIIID